MGSWLSAELCRLGARVVVLIRDRVPPSHYAQLSLAEKVIEVPGELEDRDVVERILNEYEVDTCFHLAAQALVTTATRNPLSTFRSNLTGTWNLLEAARQSTLLKAIVVASTDKAYGDAAKLPYREDMPLAGKYPYDVSKVCVDLLCQSYFHTYQLPVTISRCGNLYGGGDFAWDRLIPGTIRSILRSEPPVIRSNGQLRRDYFYIEDAVGAYLRLGEVTRRGKYHGEAFNFAAGESATVLDVVHRLLRMSGVSNLKPKILNQASKEIIDQRLSCQKARTHLGWRPTTALTDGLRKTWDWYRQSTKVADLL